MITSKFSYKKATSVEDALSILAASGEEAKILAGGHSLIPAMKLRLNSPETLIDISRIESLSYIRESNGQLQIGAGTTHGQIEHSSAVQQAIPMLSEAAGMIGDPQVRNRGTLGGSIAHADPAADWPALLLAGNASVHLQSGSGSRVVSAGDFFMGLFMTALQENELITAISFPLPGDGHRSTYQKFTQPASRFALCGCAAALELKGSTITKASIAYSGVSAKPFRDGKVEGALVGQQLNAATIEAASQHAAENVSVMSDHFASERYRKHLTKVYTARALEALL
ncbi:MAG: xanthine dehydrogenase family protein subunit M [Bacteroidota bacterium]